MEFMFYGLGVAAVLVGAGFFLLCLGAYWLALDIVNCEDNHLWDHAPEAAVPPQGQVPPESQPSLPVHRRTMRG